jgi:hypothetical protein
MHNLRRGLAAAKGAFSIFFLLAMFQLSWAQGQPVIFSATGDVPYEPAEVPIFQKQISDHNKYSPSAFFVHVGDIAKAGQCAETNFSLAADIMKGLTVPAYVVTGDNEITDCKTPTQAFALWMKYFNNFEQNFCGAPLTAHQSDHPANFAFMMSGVLFIGIDLAGGPSPEQKDADWIAQQLQANGAQIRAAVVLAHFPPDASIPFATAFRAAAAAFGKPVLFLHGHGHAWSVGNPFPEPNILRVQVNKGASEDPLQVTVTMNTSSPATTFSLKRKPWSVPAVVNMPPCANAGADQTLANASTTATLQGQAADDGDPSGAITTMWSKVSGPGAVIFDNPRVLATTASFNVPGVYVLRLTADDTQLQGSDEVAITVQGASGPTLTINDVTVNEGNAGIFNAIFTVSLAHSNGALVTVGYQIVDGTATNGSDYVANPTFGTLTFPGLTKKRRITIAIKGDAIDEQQNETFFVNLVNATNATIADNQGVGTIINDDTPAPPKAPGNLLAKTVDASTVELNWSDYADNEDGFKLERRTAAGNFAEVAAFGPNVNFYYDTGLNPSTVYSYRVYAFNKFGISAPSNVSAIETASRIFANPYTNLALEDSTSASRTEAGFPSAFAVDGDAQNTFWSSGVVSADSVVWLRVDIGSVQLVGRVVIVWKGTNYTRNYEIQVSNNDVDWATVYSTKAGAGAKEDFLFPQILARYVRLAMTAGLKSSYRIYELELYSGGLTAPPLPPTNLVASATNSSTIALTWKHKSNDEYGFEIERALKGGAYRHIATVGPNVTSYQDGGLRANTTYVYRVRAYNFVDDSDYSNPASAKTPAGSGKISAPHSEETVAEIIPEEFVLEQNYPNPFSPSGRGTFGAPRTQIRFGLPQDSPVTIKLYTINGLEVRTLVEAEYQAGMHVVTFNAGNLPSGAYFYVMQAGDVRQVRRLTLLK